MKNQNGGKFDTNTKTHKRCLNQKSFLSFNHVLENEVSPI